MIPPIIRSASKIATLIKTHFIILLEIGRVGDGDGDAVLAMGTCGCCCVDVEEVTGAGAGVVTGTVGLLILLVSK